LSHTYLQSGLKQEDALSPMVLNIASEYDISAQTIPDILKLNEL